MVEVTPVQFGQTVGGTAKTNSQSKRKGDLLP